MNNTAVSINDNQLIVDRKPFFMRGAEIHYFRMPIETWKESLKKAKAGGMNTISSYMPWFWHEPEEGKVDLYGRTCPERNLKLFMDICVEFELKLIARPGPFVNSELRLGGFPEWLFRDHPETMSRKFDEKISSGRPCPAEGETIYRDFVKNWYAQIVPLIVEYGAAK